MPPPPIQELRDLTRPDLTRTRKQLVGEIARHTQRLQKTLEDARFGAQPHWPGTIAPRRRLGGVAGQVLISYPERVP